MNKQLPYGLGLAIEIIEATLAGPNPRARAREAIRTEHAQRMSLQHHAADMAQRVADLEAERDNTAAHVNSIARQLGGDGLQVDDIAVQVLALVVERDELRARLAEIEAQEPDMQHLFARPAPAIPADPGMLTVSMAPSSAYASGWNDCRARVINSAQEHKA